MLNLKGKIVVATLAVAAGSLGLAPAAWAGEGAAAGAVSFTLSGGLVTSAAVAAAVGKNDAGALAFEDGITVNSALAAGSAGAITISVDTTGTPSLTTTADDDFGTAQENQLTGLPNVIDINATTGAVNVGP